MKKYLYILGFAGVVLFTACSTSDDLVAENPIETPPAEQTKEQAIIVEASQDSEVPIILGTGQSRGYTRAPIDPTGVEDRYGYFKTEDGRYLGVFCLATGTQDGANVPTSLDQKWKNSVDNDMVVRLSNVPAKVAIDGNVTFMDPDDLSAVTPIETTKHYYYPMANWMKYNFYAYYPYDDGSTLSWGSNQVLVKYYEIDGSQDVIWGMSYRENPVHEATDATYADPYCAKYIRWRENHLDGKTIDYWYPKLKLNHKLVQFRFSLKKAHPTTPTYYYKTLEPSTTITPSAYSELSAEEKAEYSPEETQEETKVTDMYISNAINKLDLIVANEKPEPHPAGTDSGDMTYSGNTLPTTSLGIKDNTNHNRFDGTDDKALTLTTAAQEVGYILLPSPAIANDANFKYRLVVNLDFNGDSSVAYIDMDGSFDAGKIYDITVIVKSPMEISANAVLQPWDNTPTLTPIEYNVGE